MKTKFTVIKQTKVMETKFTALYSEQHGGWVDVQAFPIIKTSQIPSLLPHDTTIDSLAESFSMFEQAQQIFQCLSTCKLYGVIVERYKEGDDYVGIVDEEDWW